MTFVPKETPGEQYALAISFSVLATIFVGLRFYVRRITKNPLLWDDWLILVALVGTYATGLFIILGTALGNQGRHMEFTPEGFPITTPEYVMFLKMLWAGQLSQIVAVGPAKLAVLCFYRRIFVGKWFDIVSWTLIGLVSAWSIGYFFANLLECLPISQSWASAPGQGNPKCIDALPMYFSQVYSDVGLDCLIIIVPMPFVWSLRLPFKQKVAVTGIFLLGMITIAASCAKAVIFNLVGHEIQKTPDVSYFLTPIIYWPMIEASLQIVAATLPLLRPLFHPRHNMLSAPTGFGHSAFSSVHRYLRSKSNHSARSEHSETDFEAAYPGNLDSKRSFTNNNVELYTMENDGKLNVPRGTIHVKKDFDIHEVRTP